MALVAYPDSEEDSSSPTSDDATAAPAPHPPKKRRISNRQEDQDDTPPLPASFHNLYSSSVRVSTRDDPSLHGGRKRIVPHIQGNWATHVYLEWFPDPDQHSHLNSLVAAVAKHSYAASNPPSGNDSKIHSLLETPLGVPLPLHISLSAPLVLRTETKDLYLETLTNALKPLAKSLKAGITVTPDNLSWHLNEDGSRGFLVLRVLEKSDPRDQSGRARSRPQGQEGRAPEKQRRGDPEECRLGRIDGLEETLERNVHGEEHESGARVTRSNSSGMNELLKASNRVAKQFGQPELYVSGSSRKRHDKNAITDMQRERGDFSGYFHISIAWALAVPGSDFPHGQTSSSSAGNGKALENEWSAEIEEIMSGVEKMTIQLSEIKIRVGQDVTDIPFGSKKTGRTSLFSI